MTVLLLILFIVWAVSCVFAAFMGFRLGRISVEPEQKASSKVEIDPDEVRRAEREQRELYNMLTYDGTPQEPINFK